MARPRNFDLDTATEQALHVFWSHGYEGTTLSDLTEAMGINRPSLYAAFGSKEQLFEAVLERYGALQSGWFLEALEQPTARLVAQALLDFHAAAPARRSTPKGCLLVQGALACGTETDPIKRALGKRRDELERALVARFERAREEGESLPAEPTELARYVWTTCNGMAVQAVGGKTRAELRPVVDLAMRIW